MRYPTLQRPLCRHIQFLPAGTGRFCVKRYQPSQYSAKVQSAPAEVHDAALQMPISRSRGLRLSQVLQIDAERLAVGKLRRSSFPDRRSRHRLPAVADIAHQDERRPTVVHRQRTPPGTSAWRRAFSISTSQGAARTAHSATKAARSQRGQVGRDPTTSLAPPLLACDSWLRLSRGLCFVSMRPFGLETSAVEIGSPAPHTRSTSRSFRYRPRLVFGRATPRSRRLVH